MPFFIDDCLKLSIYWLNKQKFLSDNKRSILGWKYKNGSRNQVLISIDFRNKYKHLLLRYCIERPGFEDMHFNYKIQITATPCHYGGQRYWFLCPAFNSNLGCKKRVAVLYLDDVSHFFVCRHCLNLDYYSKSENRRRALYGYALFFQLLDKMEKLEKTIKMPFRNNFATKKIQKYMKIEEKLHKLAKLL